MIQTLLDACRDIMKDPDVASRHPEGLDSTEVLQEIRTKFPKAFPMASVIDVANEMRGFYG